MATTDKSTVKVSLAMLEYYDSKIKAWHTANSNSKCYIVFASREDFPTEGDAEVLYLCVDDDNFYRWDESTQDYILIGSPSQSGETEPLKWEAF